LFSNARLMFKANDYSELFWWKECPYKNTMRC
jgi:hypothetical protein